VQEGRLRERAVRGCCESVERGLEWGVEGGERRERTKIGEGFGEVREIDVGRQVRMSRF
jgi:hypothetical protein